MQASLSSLRYWGYCLYLSSKKLVKNCESFQPLKKNKYFDIVDMRVT